MSQAGDFILEKIKQEPEEKPTTAQSNDNEDLLSAATPEEKNDCEMLGSETCPIGVEQVEELKQAEILDIKRTFTDNDQYGGSLKDEPDLPGQSAPLSGQVPQAEALAEDIVLKMKQEPPSYEETPAEVAMSEEQNGCEMLGPESHHVVVKIIGGTKLEKVEMADIKIIRNEDSLKDEPNPSGQSILLSFQPSTLISQTDSLEEVKEESLRVEESTTGGTIHVEEVLERDGDGPMLGDESHPADMELMQDMAHVEEVEETKNVLQEIRDLKDEMIAEVEQCDSSADIPEQCGPSTETLMEMEEDDVGLVTGELTSSVVDEPCMDNTENLAEIDNDISDVHVPEVSGTAVEDVDRRPGGKESRSRPHWCVDYESSDEEAKNNQCGSGNQNEEEGCSFTRRRPTSSLSSEDSDSDDSVSTLSLGSDSDANSDNERTGKNKPTSGGNRSGPKTKGELGLEDLPPIEDLHITVKEEECIPLGVVYTIVESLVVIESLPNTPALNLDSVLFRRCGMAIGRIFDVFGPVVRPFYSVRFNSRQEIDEKGLAVGDTLYCAPQTEHTSYVFANQLLKEKGSDASWKDNNEPPPQYLEYSDDEEEMRAKQKIKKVKAQKKQEVDVDAPPGKKRLGNRATQGPRLNQNKQNNVMPEATPMNNQTDRGWHNGRMGRSRPSVDLQNSNWREDFQRPPLGNQYTRPPPGDCGRQWVRPAQPLSVPHPQARPPSMSPPQPGPPHITPPHVGPPLMPPQVGPPLMPVQQTGPVFLVMMGGMLPQQDSTQQFTPWQGMMQPGPPPSNVRPAPRALPPPCPSQPLHRFGCPPTFQPPVSPSPPPHLYRRQQ